MRETHPYLRLHVLKYAFRLKRQLTRLFCYYHIISELDLVYNEALMNL